MNDKNYIDPKDREVREAKLGCTIEENWARLDRHFKANKKLVKAFIKNYNKPL